ncbi:MAG: phosphoribosylglycinamide formyltransferase [Acidobacteriota bacterium]|nr:phosphoribosylglycinamide formyltransferase [Acidobacteriota bacterium]
MSDQKKLALFISGTGGNALNLVRACREGRIPAEPVLVVASRATAPGIQKLRDRGLLVTILDRKDAGSDEAYSKACLEVAKASGAHFIALAGWLRKLHVPQEWEGRILNIHPGLLPKYGGHGMYGMHVHRAVLASGEKESGCTVHLVDNELDHGRILAECRVPVLPDDSAETLQQRVYAKEMELYPRAVAEYLNEYPN